MKCADAKTRLSLVTATLNVLRAVIVGPGGPAPAAREQLDVDRRAREVRRRAGVPRVALVAQLAVERRERVPPPRRADSARVEHRARAALHRHRGCGAALAGDVGVGRSGERARGASSRTRPRFVLLGTQRAVASTAARIVAPRGRSPAAARAGPMATALARKSA